MRARALAALKAPLCACARARALAALEALLCACLLALPAAAGASETAQLSVRFSPDVPGQSTTIIFGFTVQSPPGTVPSQLRDLDLHLPAGIGIGRNTLGQAICEPAYLYAFGPSGCPRDSRLGRGSATAEVPYGPEILSENAQVYAYRGASEDEHLTVLFFAEGWSPVSAELVFPAHLLEDTGPFSGQIDTEVPIIPSLPGAADVSVVRMQSTFGPQGLTYTRLVNGREVAFVPRGATVPLQCPRGGYPFAANFTFQDGTQLTAHSTAPCGHRRRSGRERAHTDGPASKPPPGPPGGRH